MIAPTLAQSVFCLITVPFSIEPAPIIQAFLEAQYKLCTDSGSLLKKFCREKMDCLCFFDRYNFRDGALIHVISEKKSHLIHFGSDEL